MTYFVPAVTDTGEAKSKTVSAPPEVVGTVVPSMVFDARAEPIALPAPFDA